MDVLWVYAFERPAVVRTAGSFPPSSSELQNSRVEIESNDVPLTLIIARISGYSRVIDADSSCLQVIPVGNHILRIAEVQELLRMERYSSPRVETQLYVPLFRAGAKVFVASVRFAYPPRDREGTFRART